VQEQLAAAGVATIAPGSSAGPPGSPAGPPGSSAGPPGPAGGPPGSAVGPGAAARGARHNQRRGSSVVAVMAALLLIVVIAAVSLTLGSGSSLRGGIGDDSFAPATLSTVATQYRLGIGDLDVNLSAVSFPPRGRTVTMSVGIGELTIVVPRQTTVYVNAHAGVGDVQVLGVSGSTYHGRAQKGGPSAPAGHLTINAHVGMGEVQVTSA
jgi:hypothetical protein